MRKVDEEKSMKLSRHKNKKLIIVVKYNGGRKMLWHDRKRIIFGLPWSFTKYSLDEERLFIEKGIFTLKEDECRLYRVMDIALTRSFWQRLFNLGTIKVCSSDKNLGDFELKNIKNAKKVKEILSQQVEEERTKKRVISRENMGGDDGDGHSLHDFE